MSNPSLTQKQKSGDRYFQKDDHSLVVLLLSRAYSLTKPLLTWGDTQKILRGVKFQRLSMSYWKISEDLLSGDMDRMMTTFHANLSPMSSPQTGHLNEG